MEKNLNSRFIVGVTNTTDDVLAAGMPAPLFCEHGLGAHARLLADRIDAEMGGAASCGGSGGAGYVPYIVETGG